MQSEKHGFTMVSRRMLVLVLRISVRMISLPQNPKAILPVSLDEFLGLLKRDFFCFLAPKNITLPNGYEKFTTTSSKMFRGQSLRADSNGIGGLPGSAQ